MSGEWKSDRLNAEIKKHEIELLRNAKLKNLSSAPIKDRIAYVQEQSKRTEWTAEDLLEELAKHQLDEGITLYDISNELKKK